MDKKLVDICLPKCYDEVNKRLPKENRKGNKRRYGRKSNAFAGGMENYEPALGKEKSYDYGDG